MFHGILNKNMSLTYLGGTPEADCEILEEKFFPLISLHKLSASRLDFWTEKMTISTFTN